MKQDLNGVRTAQDLERKYDFVGLEKAIQQNEQSLTKVNNEINNMIESLIINLGGIVTGTISLWFYSNEPTLTNAPASSWTTSELKNEHLNDFYYDRETGYVYKFINDGGYSWIRQTDGQLVQSMALSNASVDTSDHERKVFFETTPYTPYSNGDWYITKNGDLYICQISKTTGDYAEKDFIIAAKYTDDTVASQTANELTIVKGQVTTITENQNGFAITISETTNLVNDLTDEVAAEIDERTAMLRLQSENGVPVVELGTTTSPVKTKYKNDGMYIEDNGVTTGYFKNGKAYNHDMEVIKTFKIGEDFMFVIEDDDSLSLV